MIIVDLADGPLSKATTAAPPHAAAEVEVGAGGAVALPQLVNE